MSRLWLLVLVLLAVPARAHDLRPAYLELVEASPSTFDVTWRRPAQEGQALALFPVLPCEPTRPPRQQAEPGAMVQRWQVTCDGLVGATLGVDGLSQTQTDVLVQVQWADGTSYQRVLRPDAPAWHLDEPPSMIEVAGAYTRLGIEHILGGVDHLLFVLGLLVLVRETRRLIETVTAFTVAHSITLAAATLGFVRAPRAPVEAVIALSILFLATEIAKREAHAETLTERYPWTIAFSFGLLHGFGFAGALSEVGLPPSDIPIALLTFNVGVELGQLAFIAAVLAAVATARAARVDAPAWLPRAAAYGIGSIAAFWVIERSIAMW